MRLTGIRGKKGGYKLPFISIEWWLPPRSLRLALRVARPPRYGSRRALVPWVARLRPARPAPRLRGWGLLSPPRHFKWGRGCGAARLGSAACGRRGFGIIFSYDTSGFHVCHLKAVTKKLNTICPFRGRLHKKLAS